MSLTPERLRELLDYDPDTGIFTRRVSLNSRVRVGEVAGGNRGHKYVRIHVGGRQHLAHKLAWLYVHGVWPDGQVDHVDEDKHNNRLSNLRLATQSQNRQNRSKPYRSSASGFQGVSRGLRGGWRASIRVDGKRHHLGSFATPELAYEAYLAAKKKFHPFWVDNRAERE